MKLGRKFNIKQVAKTLCALVNWIYRISNGQDNRIKYRAD